MENHMNFRIALAIALLATTGIARAQDYPNKPIHMIIPLATASAVDNAARIIAQRMSESLGQQIVIENQPGAAGLIGAERLAKSAPDGYTIGAFNDSILTMVPNMHEKMTWDPVKDFEPVSLVGVIEWGMITGPNTPYKTAADVIAAAKANPGKLDYGSGGNGSPQHVAMALFANTAGITLTHVPYKGASQAAVGVAAGEVPIAMQGLGTVAGLVNSGKLRLIGVSTPAKLASFPDVPTISDSGLPGFEFRSWFAMVAPAGTSKAIIARLNAEVKKAVADPAVREKLIAQGFSIVASSPEQLGSMTKDQLARYSKLMKAAGIKAD
jgi:tripartite-type tricarboxylate transporter receptor subunit TctC